jgi:hypothetical protein
VASLIVQLSEICRRRREAIVRIETAGPGMLIHRTYMVTVCAIGVQSDGSQGGRGQGLMAPVPGPAVPNELGAAVADSTTSCEIRLRRLLQA